MSEITVRITPDEDGFLGRECPGCERYFKVTPGTGLSGVSDCTCPYCGETQDSSHFLTRDQMAYAKSVALQQVSKELFGTLKQLEHTSRGGFIGISIKVEGGDDIPVAEYEEKKLETEIVCDGCGLRYAVYGVFAFCPDCGVRNSVQILERSLAFAEKELGLAGDGGPHAADWIGNALASAVSAFDGFGRELCRLHAAQTAEPQKAENLSFQSIGKAAENVKKLFSIDMPSFVSSDEWKNVVRAFQKRHLIAHRAGVIDEQYIAITQDPDAELGRKIRLDAAEIRLLLATLATVGRQLAGALGTSPATPVPSTSGTASPSAPPSRAASRGPQLAGNPFGLSNDAVRLAAAIATRDSDLGYTFVDGSDLSEETAITGLAFDAVIGELADARLVTTQWVGGRTFVEATCELPRALVRTLDYDPREDDLRVANAAVDANAWLTGPELVDKTHLPINRVNRAVLRLKQRDDIEVMQTMGTAPYRFRQVKATGDTLRFVRSRV